MIFAHISDLHLTDGPELEEQASVLDQIVGELVKAKPDAVFLTGDFYGHTVPHRSSPKERVVLFDFVSRILAFAPVIIVYGNHDYPHDLEPLANLGGDLGFACQVVAGAEVIQLWTAKGAVQVFCMAYPSKRWLLAGKPAMGAEKARVSVGESLERLLDVWRLKATQGEFAARVVLGHCTTRSSRLAGGEVLAGHEIEVPAEALHAIGADYCGLGHIHLRQRLWPRVWHVGSPWRNSFGETEDKGWHIIRTGEDLEAWQVEQHLDDWPDEAALADGIEFMPTHPRPRVTLDYRWASTSDTAEPRWVTYPYLDQVDGAYVRARLVVPQQWASTVPWDEELALLRKIGAYRVKVERVVEPILRTRAPEVATAATTEDKLKAFWGTLATPLDEHEQGAALECLHELETEPDEVIRDATDGKLTISTLLGDKEKAEAAMASICQD